MELEMKVYILIEWIFKGSNSFGQPNIAAVFSDHNKALQAVTRYQRCTIQEMDVIE